MLRSFPRLRNRASLLATLLFVVAGLPGLSHALSATLELVDPGGSGFGATVVLDDEGSAGDFSISIESTGPAADVADLLAFFVVYDSPPLPDDLEAVGDDVSFSVNNVLERFDPAECDCATVLADLGALPIFSLSGVTSTEATLTHPTEALTTLQVLDGALVSVFLGFDLDDADAPGIRVDDVKVLKLEGTLTVIPEPSTALLMMLGLIGLSFGARRVQV